MDPSSVGSGQTERVFVGTTRAPYVKSYGGYSGRRTEVMQYARLDVSVPPERKRGRLHSPKEGAKSDPNTQFFATDMKTYRGGADFRADLRRAILGQPGDKREAVIFVHGYNTRFHEGVYRAAQLGHDFRLTAALVHFSWASRGDFMGYAYDHDSATIARDGLEKLLGEVEAAGARTIIIVAHSLGTEVTMEALRQIAIARNGGVMSKIDGVILVSPDIDIDVFRAQAKKIGKLPEPFVIFTSRKDRALGLSADLTGQRQRLGNIKDVDRLADLKVTLVDTTAFSTGAGHFNPGDSPALIAMLERLPDLDAAFASDGALRTGLLPGAALTIQNATEIVLAPLGH
ncbi:MAG TPA: alpha/beta fold hydrolase [Albidovulum sp.]|uniref:alpha/beta hydrolase n=1 Tax=Albidovulum sp. TaxID=1872424 RepID=UPI002BC1B0C7|nr:alpha/beta fold hydrolase [Albidovulum sp.]